MSRTSESKNRKSPSSSTPAPRKRRKRTVVSGAAADCFTCAQRSAQCDRRRPYCSQCLENGLDCSGYKTTLTWGVGVASRGKFRGLSVPVRGAQPADTTSATTGDSSSGTSANPTLSPSTIPTSQSYPLAPPPLPHSHPHPHPHYYQQPSPVSDVVYENTPQTHVPSSPAQSWAPWSQLGLPTSHQSAQIPVLTPSLLYPGATDSSTDPDSISATSGSWAREAWPPTHSPATAELSYPPRTQDASDDQTVEEIDRERRPRRSSLMSTSQSPSLSQLLLARSVGRTPRLRYLISYYAEVIAPVIVAFDSPTNPFRTSILRLAQESTSLQEAIATLATSNLRQRRERGVVSTGRTEPARMSSLAHRALTDIDLQEWYDPSLPEGFWREEQYHRGMAVKELNKELADPRKRLSDSVLATLLILCLFHVCDTGVAQFKTQFAGVTKLLAIRMRNSSYLSDELKWFIRMFTWYDTMTATTNDREIQLQNTCVDLTAVSDGEWGLENLAGCDAGLFRLIAHLVRLNLLSQSQEASTPTSSNIFIPTTTPPPSMFISEISTPITPYAFPLPTPPQPGDQTKQPLSPTFWAEWFSIRQQLEAWRFPRERSGEGFSIEAGFTASPGMMDTYISPPSSPLSRCGVAPHNVEDVFHISESFRYSAILYSERLAYPDLPSSHPRIQQIVQQSMAHILAVKSDVYLLWPLFITGSECVFDEHRIVIQERCKEISKDSGFFNNLSCLELLQKIWQENAATTAVINGGGSAYIGTAQDNMPASLPSSWSVPNEALSVASNTVSRGQGFRWHQVMQAKRAEGEYMVV